MIAETYRPRDFAGVLGQSKVAKSMQWHLDRPENCGKAFLITGPSGSGKTTLAHCCAEHWGIPEHGRHMIQSATCDVGTLNDVAGAMYIYGPGLKGRKMYLLDEVHTVTGRAADRLLSLLEDLPAHVLFVGTTTQADWTDGILLSRWTRFQLAKIPSEDVAQHLVSVAMSEGLPIPEDPDWARKLVKYQGLNLRDQLNQLPDRLFAMA